MAGLKKEDVLIANASNTVGLIMAYNPKQDFVAEVNPLLLKQWAEMVYEQFGEEDVVYVSVHRHPDVLNTARQISAASEYGDDLRVVVCGTDCNDIEAKGETHG